MAEASNVSMMTVSRVMRNAQGVHPETRERVQSVARRLGYVPNRVASNLVTRRTQTIGIVVPNIERFFPQIVMAVEEVLDQQGYQQFVCCSRDSVAKERDLVEALLSRRVDGLLLASVSCRESERAVALAQAQEVPVVLIDRLINGVELDSVVSSDFNGAREAVAALLSAGRERLVHLAGPPENWAANERCRGFQAALGQSDVPCPADAIVRLDASVESGRQAMAQLLDRQQPPDAVFCYNDLLAAGAYSILREEGVAVPERIRLSCFGNIPDSDVFTAPVDLVVQDSQQMGHSAAKLLMARIAEPDFLKRRPTHKVLPVHLHRHL